MEKIYEVEFINYTTEGKYAVKGFDEHGNQKNVHVGEEPFLIRESEFEKYRKWGNGFRVIRFVGNLR